MADSDNQLLLLLTVTYLLLVTGGYWLEALLFGVSGLFGIPIGYISFRTFSK